MLTLKCFYFEGKSPPLPVRHCLLKLTFVSLCLRMNHLFQDGDAPVSLAMILLIFAQFL